MGVYLFIAVLVAGRWPLQVEGTTALERANTTHHLGLVAHDYGQYRNGVKVNSYRTVVSSTTKRPRCKRTLGANATACISVAKGRPRKVRIQT